MAKKADKVKNNSELAVSVDTAKNAAPAKKTNKKNANNDKKPNIFKRMGKGIKAIGFIIHTYPCRYARIKMLIFK